MIVENKREQSDWQISLLAFEKILSRKKGAMSSRLFADKVKNGLALVMDTSTCPELDLKPTFQAAGLAYRSKIYIKIIFPT